MMNKQIFLSNNNPCFEWQKNRDIFLQLKSKSQRIIVFEFLFFLD